MGNRGDQCHTISRFHCGLANGVSNPAFGEISMAEACAYQYALPIASSCYSYHFDWGIGVRWVIGMGASSWARLGIYERLHIYETPIMVFVTIGYRPR